jgi:hypothetical protein
MTTTHEHGVTEDAFVEDLRQLGLMVPDASPPHARQ